MSSSDVISSETYRPNTHTTNRLFFWMKLNDADHIRPQTFNDPMTLAVDLLHSRHAMHTLRTELVGAVV